ncbi:hypothetical protein OAT84_01190 [Gammaproteobacteria bacterium]|nr:hypothetical protein [Gammaproteobacteria bacterium]
MLSSHDLIHPKMMTEEVPLKFLPSLELLIGCLYLSFNHSYSDALGTNEKVRYFIFSLFDIELLSFSKTVDNSEASYRIGFLGFSYSKSEIEIELGFHKACLPLGALIAASVIAVCQHSEVSLIAVSLYAQGWLMYLASIAALSIVFEAVIALVMMMLNRGNFVKQGDRGLYMLNMSRLFAAIAVGLAAVFPYKEYIWLSVLAILSLVKVVIHSVSLFKISLPIIPLSVRSCSFKVDDNWSNERTFDLVSVSLGLGHGAIYTQHYPQLGSDDISATFSN